MACAEEDEIDLEAGLSPRIAPIASVEVSVAAQHVEEFVEMAAEGEACPGSVEDLGDLDSSCGSAPMPAPIAACSVEEFIDLDFSCNSARIADARVPTPASPRVELLAGKVVEATEEVVVCARADFAEVVDCPTAGEMDILPSPIFDLGYVNLLEEDRIEPPAKTALAAAAPATAAAWM